MYILMFLLSILSFIALILGLINPKIVIKWGITAKKTRGKVLRFYGLLMILFFIAFVILTPEVTSKDQATQKVNGESEIVAKNEKEDETKRSAVKKSNKNTEIKADDEKVNSIGNSMGNIRNGGIAAKQGDWVYYMSGKNPAPIGISNVEEQGSKLYKMKLDGSNKKLLSTDHPAFINVIGDWVYYVNLYDNEIYKIRIDGKNKTKLTNGFEEYGYSQNSMIVKNNWIYFLRYYPDEESGSLFRMKSNGKEIKELRKNVSSFYISNDDTLYYISDISYISGDFYKANLDGSGEKVIKLKEPISNNFIVEENYIYYTQNYGRELVKVRTDGTNYNKFSIDTIMNDGPLNYKDGWIYLGLGKIKSDGTETQLIVPNNPEYRDQGTYDLTKDQAKNMDPNFNPNDLDLAIEVIKSADEVSIIDDWVFLGGGTAGVFRMKMDGSIIEKLDDFETNVEVQ